MLHEDYCFVQDIARRNNMFKTKMHLKGEVQIQKIYIGIFSLITRRCVISYDTKS